LAEGLSDLARTTHDAFVLSGRCLPYGEANVWWPVAEALREAGGIEPGDSAESARHKCRKAVLVATRLDPESPDATRMADGLLYFIGHEDALQDMEPARAREQATRAVQDVLEGIARRHPVVLVLSELHWADPFVFEIVEKLLDRMRHLPFMVVGTARPELEASWTPKPGHHNLLVLHVDALDTEAAERLLEVLLGAPAPD